METIERAKKEDGSGISVGASESEPTNICRVEPRIKMSLQKVGGRCAEIY